MRFKRIALSGFRAFATTTTVDLDADCVILSGANGQGKTSLLDGIFWALTGRLERLGTGDDKLVSLYSETGGASVSLTLSTDEEDLTILRRFDGQKTNLTCRLGDRPVEGDELQRRFGTLVVQPSDLTSEAAVAFATAMARSLYLQQDSIRDFINADTDDTRFRVVAELCGLGRVTDLQAALQQQRKGWTQATNQLQAQTSVKRTRLAELRDRSSRLAAPDSSVQLLSSKWEEWWRQLKEIVPSFREKTPDVGSAAADAGLDRAMRLLDSTRLEVERRRDAVADAIRLVQALPVNTSQDEDVLRTAVKTAEVAEARAREALRAGEAKNLSLEQELLQAKTSDRDLWTLAELALRHLGDKCPVCDQTFDKEATVKRLRAYLESSPAQGPTIQDLSPLVQKVAAIQSHTLAAAETLRNAESKNARARQARGDLQKRLEQLGIELSELPAEVQTRLETLQQQIAQQLSLLAASRTSADQLSLSLARASELAQRKEVDAQLAAADQDVQESERLLAERERAGHVASNIAEEMREASLEIVDAELQRIEPLFQRIWAGIDPHPSFRAVNLISKLSYGKGRLSMRVRDDGGNVSSESPEVVLSSSQLNALAVALFLTLNLGTQSLPLAATVVDDPFQSLDDINLLGMVDLLRRMSGKRQLLLATHEHRFAQLLARKLRPIDEGQSTKIVEFDNWDRMAPLVTEREVGREISPFRFVA